MNYLSPFPQSMFGKQGFIRKNPKVDLYKLFETHLSSESLLNSFYYVIDGGWLLHKYDWPKPRTFGKKFEGYFNFAL